MNLYVAILRIIFGKFAFALSITVADRSKHSSKTRTLALIIILAIAGLSSYLSGWFNVFLILKPYLSSIV